MKILGFELTRIRAADTAAPVPYHSGGWWPLIGESFAGAWQRNVEIRYDRVLTYSAVFRCISLIAGDIAKMRVRLMRQDASGIWAETTSPAFSPVLRKPNGFQNRIQFYASWVESKLTRGNTYVLKARDNQRVVIGLYVLDPERVRPLVSDMGEVYYELRSDNMAGLTEPVVVPASEIIHDRWNTLHHPLVGLSPLTACGLAAVQGLQIQNNSATFFGNGSRPSGILSAPGNITPENEKRIRDHWETKFSGQNFGRVAVLGNGLAYTPMGMTAEDSQLVEQLRWSAETVAGTFGVPGHKIGVGAPPSYNNIEALNLQYYSQCLQIHIESIEAGLDEGLALPENLGTSFDLNGLLRMDSQTRVRTQAEGVKAGIIATNEARAELDLPPVKGGETPWLQEQNWPLSMLADRDPPTREPTPPAPIEPPPSGEPEPEPEPSGADQRAARARRKRAIATRKLDHVFRRHSHPAAA